MNAPMSEQQLAEILARANAATAGPWKWSGNTEVRDMRLQAQHHGGLTVMDFVRWGMQDACPRFARNWVMYRADEMVEYQVHQLGWVDKSEPPYRADISGIDHPDARFIAAAREDVPELVAEVQRLRAERHSTNEALDDAVRELSALRARVAKLEAQLPTAQEPENPFRPCGCPKRFDRHAWGCPTVPEDPHDGPNHHDYALSRDLPFIPRQVTGRCPNGHTFEDCTCGGTPR